MEQMTIDLGGSKGKMIGPRGLIQIVGNPDANDAGKDLDMWASKKGHFVNQAPVVVHQGPTATTHATKFEA